jgi:hypothetical protein
MVERRPKGADDRLETTSIFRGVIDGGGDARLHGKERGRHVAQKPLALPSPALERALAARANRMRAVLAQSERDQETFMAIRAPVDQHPTMRRADAALREAPVRPTIAVMSWPTAQSVSKQPRQTGEDGLGMTGRVAAKP